jgi:hypothetical protein
MENILDRFFSGIYQLRLELTTAVESCTYITGNGPYGLE